MSEIKIDESMVDSLDRLVKFKYNSAFTDDQAIKALTESFVIMNNIIENSSTAESNLREMYKMLEELTRLLESSTKIFEDKSELKSLISNINDLSRIVVEQNDNIKSLIGILIQIAEQLKIVSEKNESSKFVEGFKDKQINNKKETTATKINWGAIVGVISFIVVIIWFIFKK